MPVRKYRYFPQSRDAVFPNGEGAASTAVKTTGATGKNP
jgi:hypothetical protein